jgi:spore germination cell wall hydrolase CwlJ-like protein
MGMKAIKRVARNVMTAAVVLMATTSEASNLDVIAKTLYYEARGEGEIGMRAVASVLHNRAVKRSGKVTSTTIATECKRRLQFSCWNGKQNLPSGKGNSWAVCMKIAGEMVAGKFVATHTHTHYYAYNLCKPKWDNGVAGLVIGNHKFLTVRGRI